jgi:hypothetical protein
MEQMKRETKKPSIIENLKSGAIAIGKQESILAAIKNDPEFSVLTDQNQKKQWKDVENMSEITTLEDGTYIIAQKFSIFNPDNTKTPVIIWSPVDYKDMLKVFKITEGNADTMIYSEAGDLKELPSFLGKNIKKVFSKIEAPQFEIETFVRSYVSDEEYTLNNNTFYRLYVDDHKNNKNSNFNIRSLKATRDAVLSPKRQKQQTEAN